jgi:hypothetical protein
MAKIVVVGCKLPHGINIEHPMDPTKTVELKGKNKSLIIGADYSTTEVDADFFEQWVAVNKEFPAVKSGAIFVAKSAADVAAVAAEFKDRKTGFEPMRTDGKDERASGVKAADKD